MGEMVATGSKYSDQERMNAAVQYAITGSLVKVEKATGIPDTTICTWKKADWWDEVVAKVRSEKSEEHIAIYTQIVDLAQQQTLDKLPEATAAQASIIAATATDKALLLSGKPTSITGQSAGIQALAQQFKDLSEKWDEKQVRVVDTQ